MRERLRRSKREVFDVKAYVLPHFAAVVEEFSRASLIECSEPLVPADHALLRELWSQAEQQAEGTWAGQEEAWKTWHNVQLKSAQQYQDFKPVVDARNAIVHGLGELTRRQTRAKDGGAQLIKNLQRVGIGVEGRRLVLTDQAMKNAVRLSRAVIEWLDREIETKALRV